MSTSIQCKTCIFGVKFYTQKNKQGKTKPCNGYWCVKRNGKVNNIKNCNEYKMKNN